MNGKEVSQLPMRKYDGPVQLIESEQDLSQAVRVIGSEQIVGLDTETKPAFRKGEYYLPSLIQIAASSAVYLFQLKRMDFSSALREILENPAIIKAGIGVADDLLNLNKVFEFSPERILDLSLIAQRNGIKRSGVRNLAGFPHIQGCLDVQLGKARADTTADRLRRHRCVGLSRTLPAVPGNRVPRLQGAARPIHLTL